MSALREEILAANERFVAGFDERDRTLSGRPTRGFAVVTCMDSRVHPPRFLGLSIGDAHVIRNAGGLVTDDALRSLVISHWLLGTQEAVVIGHTDCGMLKFTDDDLRRRLADEAGVDASGFPFLTFPDLESSIREGVRKILDSELLPPSYAAAGFVYDVQTGRLHDVA